MYVVKQSAAIFRIADQISFPYFITVSVLQSQIILIIVLEVENARIEEISIIEYFDDFVDLWNLLEIDICIDHVALFFTKLAEQEEEFVFEVFSVTVDNDFTYIAERIVSVKKVGMRSCALLFLCFERIGNFTVSITGENAFKIALGKIE